MQHLELDVLPPLEKLLQLTRTTVTLGVLAVVSGLDMIACLAAVADSSARRGLASHRSRAAVEPRAHRCTWSSAAAVAHIVGITINPGRLQSRWACDEQWLR